MLDGLWNVRGVGREARQVAKMAAAVRGVTMGKWLEEAIGTVARAEMEERGRKREEEKEKKSGKAEEGAEPETEAEVDSAGLPSSGDLDTVAEEQGRAAPETCGTYGCISAQPHVAPYECAVEIPKSTVTRHVRGTFVNSEPIVEDRMECSETTEERPPLAAYNPGYKTLLESKAEMESILGEEIIMVGPESIGNIAPLARKPRKARKTRACVHGVAAGDHC